MGNQEHESSWLLTVNQEQTRKEEEELEGCFGEQQFLLEGFLIGGFRVGPGKELAASVFSNWPTGWMLLLDYVAFSQWLAD